MKLFLTRYCRSLWGLLCALALLTKFLARLAIFFGAVLLTYWLVWGVTTYAFGENPDLGYCLLNALGTLLALAGWVTFAQFYAPRAFQLDDATAPERPRPLDAAGDERLDY